MSMEKDRNPTRMNEAGQFASTQWSVVLAAAERSSPDGREALAQLCRTYWFPIYSYVRRQGRDEHDAQDLVQAFFAHLLEKNAVAAADRQRGRFRSFLLASLDHFLINQWKKETAQKRGGDKNVLSLDFASGETRYARQPVDERTPQFLFDRQWAITLLDEVMDRLQQEYQEAGKGDLFNTLKSFIAGSEPRGEYQRLAETFSMTPQAVRAAVYRLRRRYEMCLRGEIAATLSDPSLVDEEIADLFTALQG